MSGHLTDHWEQNYLLPPMAQDRWWNFRARGRLADELGNTLEYESLQRPPLNIVVAGHSFIRRLNDFACEKYGFFHNFKMEHYVANVQCIGISGLTVEKLVNSHLHKIMESSPHIVYLEIGTNDLCSPDKSPKQVGDSIIELCGMLSNLGVKKIIVGEVTFREPRGIPAKTPDFNYKVLRLNRYLQVRLDDEANPQYFFWRHKYLWRSALQVYADGVHYNKHGNIRLFRSIRGALLKFMWQLRSTGQ